ncbi:hypothetical protein HYQ45_012669 [Verticillium longisporum]|uniref:Uncharacterized protein n=3 Tax=Verticillium TaxID=1036719 RepID=G2X2T1_VERDV|nr:uncharacterized protein VDAG_04125 [Verticillium dahliae VdLs.17]KAF3346478.1 hypothetical protein VdG2_05737 [Verticillium dahliae VDG2]KAG7127378.1 hypothetical protein HYQ45_012669 [Verticillium longisporum]KAH6686594.1 hypothetical protein EV126DRAFT_136144 [Verticillium dahliae]EGY22687.1 hypothetical protein VDAG_04125 [Verticillium dahliae VdLs.17]PNH34594.1 hypothetical protein BJF96_g2001 [Verticillium dahliae]
MRFNNILLAGAFAVAYAQETTVTTVPGVATPTGVDAAASSAAAAINRCLKECDATDSTCQARCVSVPAPSDAQAIALDKCVGDCDQGDGSEAETNAFAQCRDQCIKEHYFDADSTNGAPADNGNAAATQTTGAAAGTQTGTTTGTAATGSSTGTATDSDSGSDNASGTAGSDASETTGADSGASLLVSSSLGFFGLVAAFFL